MSLIDQAKEDWKTITSNTDEFGIAITLEATPYETADVIGLHTKHHLSLDTEGNPVNSRNAHISVSEALIIAANPDYPIRNAKGEVYLKNHKVTVKDSTGVAKTYVINEWFPDETIGVIVIILGDYGAN